MQEKKLIPTVNHGGGNIYLRLLCCFGLLAAAHIEAAKNFALYQDTNIFKHYNDILLKVGRSASNCSTCIWPKNANGTVPVPYTLSADYTLAAINTFMTAMQEYETLTCLRFVPRTGERDYLDIISSGSRCLSYLGRIGGGQQLYLIPKCVISGIVQHELNHALGFSHEQARMDRDNYVDIKYQFIYEASWANFDKQNNKNMVLGYDYGSVMHYDAYAFSNTSNQPSIVPKPDHTVPIGQRDGLSVLDVAKINQVYQCNVSATLLNKEKGVFTSANYPSAYPNNVNWVWLIRTPSGQASLTFSGFNLQSSLKCKSDYMRIYDGPTKNSVVLWDKFCGNQIIPQLIASTNRMLVEFVSDGAVAGLGFKDTYNTVQCGGTFFTFERKFTSPNYPNFYSPNLDCTYTITAPAGYRIALSVTDFQVEYSWRCRYDYLQVNVDGTVTTYCSNIIDSKITSTGTSMVLKFHSDRLGQARGFQAYYTFCK
ncbi:PREDICTED: embryonic protein UVS.2-like [Nanorana parkeri]|uniref:embryonic protein UVS.2-like n=1 Tax=Nanorana parkeri TaxID=125878 RepID=UPI0008548DCD|nr:PREDICTED: embryonic protein UVS.2-like [Nanorana parkeri]